MKKIILLVSLLTMFLSSCASDKNLHKVGHVYRWSGSQREAYYDAGYHRLSNRHDKSGAFVKKSSYTLTTYQVDAGWISAEGSFDFVAVFFQGQTTVIDKRAYGTTRRWKARVNGHICEFVIDVTKTAAFGRLLKDGLIVGRYQF